MSCNTGVAHGSLGLKRGIPLSLMLKLLHRKSIDLLIQSLDAGWPLLS